MNLLNVFAAILLFVFLNAPVGYAAAPTPDPNKSATTLINEHKKNMKLALAQIETLNKMDEQECVGDGECEELEMGESRCGGPSKAVVVSTNNTNLPTIKALVGNYTAAEKGLNTVEMGQATCGSFKNADARCVKNKCIDKNQKKN
jgi:hypothetical protein